MADKIIKYDDIVVYENGEWVDSVYKNISITGGEDVTNTTLINTLSTNAEGGIEKDLRFNETNTNLEIYENLSPDDYAKLEKEEHTFYIVKGVGVYKGNRLIASDYNDDKALELIDSKISSKLDLNGELQSGEIIVGYNQGTVTGSGTNISDLATKAEIEDKQDTLTAGKNISLEENNILDVYVPVLYSIPETLSQNTPSLFRVNNGLYFVYHKPVDGYLTFSGDSAFTLEIQANTNYDGSLEYSTDTISWTTVTKGQSKTIYSVNNKIYLRGSGNSYCNRGDGSSVFYISRSNVRCSGNIETLLDYNMVLNNKHPKMSDRCFDSMFSGCTNLTQAPTLPATTLSEYCYCAMFWGCENLTQAPVLPATTLKAHCYEQMFCYCTNLTQAPALPATTLAKNCYNTMFGSCTNLTQAPALPATTLADYCYEYMFSSCNNLTQAPALPATTLAEDCYSSMFNNCTSLAQAPALPATTLAVGCYGDMFRGCTNLTTLPALIASTLAFGCYSSMFYGCTSIKLSTTKTGEYVNEYRIPYGTTNGVMGDPYNSISSALSWMFYGTGGTFADTPEINTIYYTSNEIIQ